MTPRAGVIGWPVGHSLSPRIHRYWMEAVVVPPGWLADTIDGFRLGGWAGFNVTVPHKEAVMALLDRVDDLARAVGAVNTVVAVGDGRFEGRNTDADGFIASLRASQSLDAGRPAMILGAGGAARAIAAALTAAGFREIRIANRNRDRAEALALCFPARVCDWNERERALDGIGVLINATSLGMAGQPPLDLDLGFLPGDAIVTDIVYRPLETELLAAARARGNSVVDGLGMLLHQAVEGFSAWFGVVPEVTPALRRHVLAAVEHAG
jgi:shikimate dehydrogenase